MESLEKARSILGTVRSYQSHLYDGTAVVEYYRAIGIEYCVVEGIDRPTSNSKFRIIADKIINESTEKRYMSLEAFLSMTPVQ